MNTVINKVLVFISFGHLEHMKYESSWGQCKSVHFCSLCIQRAIKTIYLTIAKACQKKTHFNFVRDRFIFTLTNARYDNNNK